MMIDKNIRNDGHWKYKMTFKKMKNDEYFRDSSKLKMILKNKYKV